jgi:hypothetical protein
MRVKPGVDEGYLGLFLEAGSELDWVVGICKALASLAGPYSGRRESEMSGVSLRGTLLLWSGAMARPWGDAGTVAAQ